MQIQIVSKGIDVSKALEERISDRLEEMMDKYIHREGDAQVSVTREGTGFKTVVSVHLPSGSTFEGEGRAQEAYPASDEALEHVEKRLRRYKRRLKDHSQKAKAKEAALFVLSNPVSDTADDDGDDDAPISDEPMVIAEKTGQIRTLTPGMAALEVGLADSGVVVFHNSRHGGLNVVYKRPDGHIGWIDPKDKS
ncbi:ribosome-associated translation inhibitor RaiA [uncultured Algimonas sp.]|uniref:ribosome hibernation-promoting factor, HPF/YfiA family n=1 Tax=uncultured Algimonas sp. TaxID=1547920 RepID=UPI002619B39A|nr:ribosome-associated translation inhibitor RaiA [uncultured Algimonas sp.]